MAEITEIRPQPKQIQFLSTSADVAFYGGSAGGGKSWSLLMEPLRHIANGRFGAVIFRRTYPQVTNEGGLWDQSTRLYPYAGAKPKQGDLTWVFPSGAKFKFAHLQHETSVLDWQGSEIPYMGFDELTHFTEKQFFYMLSRNRSTCGIRPYVRAGMNPDADSWVSKFIEWWIDDNGFAISERGGVIRWFIRHDGVIRWGDTPEELKQQYGDDVLPKSFTFVPATIHDNQQLLRVDPGYLANLQALSLVERQRLLDGNWKVRPEAGKVFNRDWFEIVDAHQIPKDGVECRSFDFAASVKELEGDDPDYTADVKIRKFNNTYYIMDCRQVRKAPADIDNLVKQTVKNDVALIHNTPIRYMVRWEIEPGSAGLRENWRLSTLLDGYDCGGVRPTGDKLTRAKPLAAQAEVGNVKLLRGAWNEEFLTHMHHQPDWTHDDIMDAASGAYNELSDVIADGLLESAFSWN